MLGQIFSVLTVQYGRSQILELLVEVAGIMVLSSHKKRISDVRQRAVVSKVVVSFKEVALQS